MSICPSCQQDTQDDWKFCRRCGHQLQEIQMSSDEFVPSGIVARLISPSDMEGLLNKTLVIQEGQAAMLMVDGRFDTTLGPGRHSIGNVLRSKPRNSTVALYRTSDVPLHLSIPRLLTSDPLPLSLALQVTLALERPELFWSNLAQGLETYDADRLTSTVYPVIEEACQTYIQGRSLRELDSDTRLGDNLNLAMASGAQPAFSHWGLRLVSVRAVDMASEIWDEVSDQRVQYSVGMLEREVELEGRKRLFDVAMETDIQDLAEETARVAGVEKRLGLWERMRQAVLTKKRGEIASQAEIEDLVRDADRDRLLKDTEQQDLVRTIQEAKDDHEKSREFALRRIDAEQNFEYEKLSIVHRNGLEQERIALEAANARQQMESRWYIELRELDWQIERDRRAADFRRQQEAEDQDARNQARLGQAQTSSSIADIERGDDQKDLEMLLQIDAQRRQIKRDDQQAQHMAELDADDRRQQIALEGERQRLDMRIREEREKSDAELRRIDALSSASIETLIAVSGTEQAQMLAQLARTRALAGHSTEQILAMQAADSPEVAGALKEMLTAVAAQGQLEQYERLVSEVKENAELNREDYQRNMQTMSEMFNTALDSVRDTATAFAGSGGGVVQS